MVAGLGVPIFRVFTVSKDCMQHLILFCMICKGLLLDAEH